MGPMTHAKTELVAEYLREEAAKADGALYIKSKFIAREVDLSAKEIGWSIRHLSETESDLHIDRWAYTGATTWRITCE